MVFKMLATYAASDESPRRGLGTAHTVYPSSWRRAVTPFQPALSAQAPWSRTMVCAEWFALLACARTLAPTNNRGTMKMTTMITLSSERRYFGAFDSLWFMIDLLITKNWLIVKPVQASPWTV